VAHTEIRLERLVGRRVRTMSGETVGRIEEIRVKRQGDAWVVQAYLLGPYALLERLLPRSIGPALRRVLRSHSSRPVDVVPWDKLDLSDPERPRLLDPQD
jgi:sporulation protein YlmC with PRC-barrel domain